MQLTLVLALLSVTFIICPAYAGSASQGNLLIAQGQSDSGALLPPPRKNSQSRLKRLPQSEGADESTAMPPNQSTDNQPDNQPNYQPNNQKDFARPIPYNKFGAGVDQGQAMPGRKPPARNQQGAGRFFGSPLDLSILQLSDEQKQRIKAMRQQSGPQARQVRQVLRAKREEFRDLMFDPVASDSEIKSKRKEVKQLQDQLEEIQLGDFLQLRSMLTKDQKLQLPDVKPKRP